MKSLSEFIVNKRMLILTVMLILTAIFGFLIPKANINQDMKKYLADSSNMKQGTDIMEREFGELSQPNEIRLMIKDLQASEKSEIAEWLKEVRDVDSVSYEAEDVHYNKDGYTLYKLTTEYKYDSVEETAIRTAIAEHVSGYEYALEQTNKQPSSMPPAVIITALAVVLVILLAMCGSWFETVLFAIVIGAAVVLNMGTNIFKESVSQVTFGIAAILQLVLSMDYSIIIMNRYRLERATSENPAEAMKKALANAFSSVTSSAITTIVGLLMLVFMNFKIGADIGIVLAKGVTFSLICVFTILPALTIIFHKAIEKTAKPVLPIPTNGLARFSFKLRIPLAILFIVIFFGSFYIQNKTKISFAGEDQSEINKVFQSDIATVVLYNNGDEDKIQGIVDELTKNPKVSSVISYPTALNKMVPAAELTAQVSGMSADMSFDEYLMKILYYRKYKGADLPEISLSNLINFIADEVAQNPMFASYLDADVKANIGMMKMFADKEMLTRKMTIPEISALFGLDEASLQQLAKLRTMKYGAEAGEEISPQEFIQFVKNDVLKNPLFASALDASMLGMIDMADMLVNAVVADQKFSVQDTTEMLESLGLELDEGMVGLLYTYYGSVYDYDDGFKMSIIQLLDYINDDVLNDKTFAGMIDEKAKLGIRYAKGQMGEAVKQIKGENYSLLSISAAYPNESDETMEFMGNLNKMCDSQMALDHYIIGNSAMFYEMTQTFKDELLLMTLLTAFSIFMIVLLTFRKVSIPVILVLIVQSAVFITAVVSYLQGFAINFLAYVIVQCILMGATIDYGILFTNNYREHRKTEDIISSLKAAYFESVHTILTSGLIIVLATAIVGFAGSDPNISPICQTISVGATAAIIMIMFILPGLLSVFDRFIVKKVK